MRTTLVLALVPALAPVAAPSEGPGSASHALRLIPWPKWVRSEAGSFAWSAGVPVAATRGTDPADRASLEALIAEATATLGVRPTAAAFAGPDGIRSAHALVVGAGPEVAPRDAAAFGPEAYALGVAPGGITVRSATSRGLFLGVQTLRQLIRANAKGAEIPCVHIEDWPDLGLRSYSDDITRGPSPTLDFLEREVEIAAHFKLNGFTYYLEDQFLDGKHPDIGPEGGRLLPAELRALVDFAAQRNVEVIGNQQSFGHFAKILALPAYRRLAETADVISPAVEESYRLLEDRISAQAACLDSKLFNVCCDEVSGLGSGPAKKLVEEMGPGRVYARHIRRVHDIVHGKLRKDMLMWGDIALSDPVILPEIPKDVRLINWAYDDRPSFEAQIEPFVRHGFGFYVAPGVSCWSRILPDFQVAADNIYRFCRDGAKHGALGVINTTWDDDGENLFAYSWHGILWGAECSWNSGVADRERFDRSFGPVFFGTKGDEVGRAIGSLSGAHRLPGYEGMLDPVFWRRPGAAQQGTFGAGSSARALRDIAAEALSLLDAARDEARWNLDALDSLRLGARRFSHIARRDLLTLDLVLRPGPDLRRASRQASEAFAALRDDLVAIREEYRRLWLLESRPYFLDRNLARFDSLADDYSSLAALLREEAERPSPRGPAEVLGVSLGLRSPALRPDTPLAGLQADWAGEWTVPGASHRIPAIIEAGGLSRLDLPVEVELAPDVVAAIGDAVEGVVCVEVRSGHERILPAQTVPAALGLPASVAWIAPGGLPKGESRRYVLYFGRPRALDPSAQRKPPETKVLVPGAAEPEAASDVPPVRVRPEAGSAFWAENGAERILVGVEGGHIDRWHVKAVGDVDVTEEGDGSWHGFSDLGSPMREARHEVRCVASGPVLARFALIVEGSLVKTVELWAGASWAEVRLAWPATYYWDFDRTSNFASDAPLPGEVVFSTGRAARVPASAETVQVAEDGCLWGAKHRADGLTLALLRLDGPGQIRVGPGGGWGGCGVERSEPVRHVATFVGSCRREALNETLSSVRDTLDARVRPRAIAFPLERR